MSYNNTITKTYAQRSEPFQAKPNQTIPVNQSINQPFEQHPSQDLTLNQGPQLRTCKVCHDDDNCANEHGNNCDHHADNHITSHNHPRHRRRGHIHPEPRNLRISHLKRSRIQEFKDISKGNDRISSEKHLHHSPRSLSRSFSFHLLLLLLLLLSSSSLLFLLPLQLIGLDIPLASRSAQFRFRALDLLLETIQLAHLGRQTRLQARSDPLGLFDPSLGPVERRLHVLVVLGVLVRVHVGRLYVVCGCGCVSMSMSGVTTIIVKGSRDADPLCLNGHSDFRKLVLFLGSLESKEVKETAFRGTVLTELSRVLV